MDIKIPNFLKHVIIKSHPEIYDVCEFNTTAISKYNPQTFDKEDCYLVEVNVLIKENEIPKGDKKYYEDSFNNLYLMAYGIEMDFVTLKVQTLIVPPRKTNEQKFLELFKK